MIALKAIQTSFTAKQTTSLHTTRLSNNKKNSTLCLCKPADSDSNGGSSPEGDTRKQELLARIAQLQAQKVRLTDYLDERSAYLTQFAEEANAEFNKVGEDALKELDEAGDRIMENIKSRMQEFEESAEQNRQEIEESENKVADLEDQMEKDRNEGLFFKNLALIGVLVIVIADSFISSSSDWRKVAALGAILVGLISQVIWTRLAVWILGESLLHQIIIWLSVQDLLRIKNPAESISHDWPFLLSSVIFWLVFRYQHYNPPMKLQIIESYT